MSDIDKQRIAAELSTLVAKLRASFGELKRPSWEGVAAHNEEDFDRLFDLLEHFTVPSAEELIKELDKRHPGQKVVVTLPKRPIQEFEFMAEDEPEPDGKVPGGKG